MKNVILLSAVLAILGTSCTRVIISPKKSSGQKKGWFKNRHNPHHPNSNNPGHNKKDNGNGKKKFYRVNIW